MLNTPFPPWPSYTDEEADAVRDVLLSNEVNYWTGNECREFEKEFSDWRTIWQQRKAKKPQRIAFEWSLLPTRQQYQPADYNWGMMVYRVPHGATFDLNLFWTLDGEEHNATIKKLQCAKDVYIPPPDAQ